MKKGFAVGTLVDRLRKKEPVDKSVVTQKLELARSDVNEAETMFREVQRQPANNKLHYFVANMTKKLVDLHARVKFL